MDSTWRRAIAHSHREHRRLGVFAGRQLRAGGGAAVSVGRFRARGRVHRHLSHARCGIRHGERRGLCRTLDQLERTVGLKNVYVWHCNDAKAERGSKLDRHQHIGKGSIGLKPFRRLLNDPRLAHAAFIAETPIDEPLDDLIERECAEGAGEALSQALRGERGLPCLRHSGAFCDR